MSQKDLFDSIQYEYLLVVEPPKEIIAWIEDFKSGSQIHDPKAHFKRPHLSVGHFIIGESHEENTLVRLSNLMSTVNSFSMIYSATELWNKNIHLVFRFVSEYFTKVLTPKMKSTIGRNCVSGVPHITIIKNKTGIKENYTLQLPEHFSFDCKEIVLLKRRFNDGDSYREIKRFTLS